MEIPLDIVTFGCDRFGGRESMYYKSALEERNNTSGEKLLWTSVLVRAARDIGGTGDSEGGITSDYDKFIAAKWFLSDSDKFQSFRWLCDILDISPNTVRILTDRAKEVFCEYEHGFVR